MDPFESDYEYNLVPTFDPDEYDPEVDGYLMSLEEDLK